MVAAPSLAGSRDSAILHELNCPYLGGLNQRAILKKLKHKLFNNFLFKKIKKIKRLN